MKFNYKITNIDYSGQAVTVRYYVDERYGIELNVNIDIGGTVDDVHTSIKKSAPISLLEKEHYRIAHINNASTLQSGLSEILESEFSNEILNETQVVTLP